MSKPLAWVVLGSFTFIALGSAGAWWLCRRTEASPATGEPRPAGASAAERVRPMLERARHPSATARQESLDVYAPEANDAGALEARELALQAVFAEAALGLKLKLVLEAVEADPRPPESDPLWTKITEGIAELWTGAAFDRGRDLMLMESRPKARQALIDSWSRFVESGADASLSSDQRQALANDLVDVYPSAQPAQRARIEVALQRLAGDDLAAVIAGHGLEPGAALHAQRQYARQVQAAYAELEAASEASPPESP